MLSITHSRIQYEFLTDHGSVSTQCKLQPSIESNCTCILDDFCVSRMKFYRNLIGANGKCIFAIPKFYSGCFTIESVRLSSIGCFFNQFCLDDVIELLSENNPLPMNTPILVSNTSSYLPDTLLGTIIDNLMVDRWNEHFDYRRYYNRCKPLQCSYTVTTRGDLFYVFSTIAGVYGGLIVILKIVTQTIVTTVRNRWRPQTDKTGRMGEIKFLLFQVTHCRPCLS